MSFSQNYSNLAEILPAGENVKVAKEYDYREVLVTVQKAKNPINEACFLAIRSVITEVFPGDNNAEDYITDCEVISNLGNNYKVRVSFLVQKTLPKLSMRFIVSSNNIDSIFDLVEKLNLNIISFKKDLLFYTILLINDPDLLVKIRNEFPAVQVKGNDIFLDIRV